MSVQRPSVGRIVHYRSFGTPGGEFTPECRAAIITGVQAHVEQAADRTKPPHLAEVIETERYTADLFVMNPTGVFLNQACAQDEAEQRGGTWHWPERV